MPTGCDRATPHEPSHLLRQRDTTVYAVLTDTVLCVWRRRHPVTSRQATLNPNRRMMHRSTPRWTKPVEPPPLATDNLLENTDGMLRHPPPRGPPEVPISGLSEREPATFCLC